MDSRQDIKSGQLEIFDSRLKWPFTILITGPPKSGKTTWVKKLIEQQSKLIDQPIDKIIWFYGQENNFIHHLRQQHIGVPTEVVEGLPKSFEDYINAQENRMIVIDDLMSSASDSEAVRDLFCNKVQHTNTSITLLLQNIFCHGKERLTIMRCTSYLVLFKNPMDNSIPNYLAPKLMPHRRKEFFSIYRRATEAPHGYLFCDGTQSTPDYARLRTGLFESEVQIVFSVEDS